MGLINRKKVFLVLAASAALGLGALSRNASATTIFDSQGFESPNYSTGANNTLYNQPTSGMQFGALNSDSVTSAITVVDHDGVTGNAAQVTWTGADLGAAPMFDPNPPSNNDPVATFGPIITVSSDIKYNQAFGGEGTDGPFFGLRAFGSAGNSYLGAVGVDATSGELVFFDPTTGGYNTFADDATLNGGSYAHFDLRLNFDTGQATETVTGSFITNPGQVDQGTSTSETFTTSFYQSASSFYAGYLGATSTGGSGPETDSAFFDNYSITAVPEPASLGFLGVGAVAALLKRSRRRSIFA